jgi:REP element-mobilizing transposase RayT
MALYKNLYRIESTRLRTWDYRWNAAYFITICTKNREHFFGKIIHAGNKNEMALSETGKFAWNFWAEITTHFPYTILDAFTVMPNHMHGILIINNFPHVETLHRNVSDNTRNVSDDIRNTSHNIRNVSDDTRNDPDDTRNVSDSTHKFPVIIPTDYHEIKIKNESMAKISPKKGALSTIIRSYKSAVSKKAHIIDPHFEWQDRFHDHIIRTENEFNKIQNYIVTNPQNWKDDMFYR